MSSSTCYIRSMLNLPDIGFLEIASNVYDTGYPVPEWMDACTFSTVSR